MITTSKYPVWTMRLSTEAKARWSEIAKAESMTLPEFVRHCVEGYIQAGGISPQPESMPLEDSVDEIMTEPSPMSDEGRKRADELRGQPRRELHVRSLPIVNRQLPPSQLELEAEELERQEADRRRQDRPNPFEPKESQDEL